MKNFDSLKLPDLLQSAIKELGYTEPTPIQAQTIPMAIEGRDVLGCAQTGTGKTAAFLIPILTRMLDPRPEVKSGMALVLTPTRELALQIESVLKDLTVNTKHLSFATLIGGVSMQPQLRALQKKPRWIIATPGRLIDHLNRKSVRLTDVRYRVLDEADRMLDMGFLPQLKTVFAAMPQKSQTFLFSATLSPTINKIAQTLMHQPHIVTVGTVSTPIEKITQKVRHTTTKEKSDHLLDELNARTGSVIIFARTQRRADRLHKYLIEYGFKVAVIHGGKSQGQRTRALDAFRSSQVRILVATDVAARGLDIPHVAHVVNYDLPEQAEDYVHRIGRTARAGATGEALSFLIPEEKHLWREIHRLTKPAEAKHGRMTG